MNTLEFGQQEALKIELVGGKTLGLARMTQNGLRVAPGFAVATSAHREFLQATGVNVRVASVLDRYDLSESSALADASIAVADEFASTEVPAAIRNEIEQQYEELGRRVGSGQLSVAVRSSATAEDTADASFAGEYETFVGVVGAENVVDHVKLCWASAFTPHAIRYALDHNMSPLDVSMAVVVQKTVRARAAGVMFTLSPTTGDRSRIVIEASWGLGLSVVGGEVTPDRFAVDKVSLEVLERKLGDKRIEYVDGHEASPVDESRFKEFCLTDLEAVAIARLGKALEKLNRSPQDIEFAIDRELPEGENIVLLQCRPETVWSVKQSTSNAPPAMPLMDRISSSVFGLTSANLHPDRVVAERGTGEVHRG